MCTFDYIISLLVIYFNRQNFLAAKKYSGMQNRTNIPDYGAHRRSFYYYFFMRCQLNAK